jgi:hypothetical protein
MTPSARDAVQFTRESAERIAGVVRAIELAAPKGKPLTFGTQLGGTPPGSIGAESGRVFRVGNFSGAWAVGATKAVGFAGTTVTINATNLFASITGTSSRACAIAKDGGTWYLIAAQC